MAQNVTFAENGISTKFHSKISTKKEKKNRGAVLMNRKENRKHKMRGNCQTSA